MVSQVKQSPAKSINPTLALKKTLITTKRPTPPAPPPGPLDVDVPSPQKPKPSSQQTPQKPKIESTQVFYFPIIKLIFLRKSLLLRNKRMSLN
jgi:hypothetical protein